MAAIAHQRNTDARYRAGLSSPPRSRASLLGARAVPLLRARFRLHPERSQTTTIVERLLSALQIAVECTGRADLVSRCS